MAELTPESRRLLLEIARESISAKLEGRRYAPSEPRDPALREPRGAFVTLRKGGTLRGCIGNFTSPSPLYQTVAEMARSAAFGDPRFPPLDASEWGEVALEISALSPLRRVDDPARVEVGRHGLYLVRGPYRGVLLPQVATEQGWDRETFLEGTCRKAGLPPGAWREPGTEIYVFEAEIFEEGGEED